MIDILLHYVLPIYFIIGCLIAIVGIIQADKNQSSIPVWIGSLICVVFWLLLIILYIWTDKKTSENRDGWIE